MRDRRISPSFVTVAHYLTLDYVTFYMHIMKTYHWNNIFVLIEDKSIKVYTTVSLAAMQGILTLPNRVTTERHVADPSPEDYRQALIQFQSMSRGKYILRTNILTR